MRFLLRHRFPSLPLGTVIIHNKPPRGKTKHLPGRQTTTEIVFDEERETMIFMDKSTDKNIKVRYMKSVMEFSWE
jgi:hypothetical protein